MEPEITLLVVTGLAMFLFKFRTGRYKAALSARIGMSAMLVVTGVAHFAFAKGMAMMLPSVVPLRRELVYATGVMELAMAAGLHFRRWRKATAWALILFFILLTPANIYAASIHLNEQTGNLDGYGLGYLWYRLPLQVLFVTWIYISSVKYR